MATLSLNEARELVARMLHRAGANELMASATARVPVLAEAQGLASHGLSRVLQYTTHLRNGRVAGTAVPTVLHAKGGAVLIDAQEGLAFAACERAVEEGIARARDFGISMAGVTNSHHCSVVVDHLRPVVEAGMVGLGLTNSPAAMPAAGGRHPIFGTNPVAAIFPRRVGDPLMIDLSPSRRWREAS